MINWDETLNSFTVDYEIATEELRSFHTFVDWIKLQIRKE